MNAAAYARYSTGNQTDNSIAYQMQMIDDFASKNNISIVARFTDEARSGLNTKRQGFRDLLASAVRAEFDAVIIYDLSRGSRDVVDWLNFRKEMAKLNIQVISSGRVLGDITNPVNFISESTQAVFGHARVLEDRQKSISGKKVKSKDALFMGGFPPLGYDIVNQKYVVNESEARIIRKIFDLHAAGYSYNYILDQLDGARGKRGRPIGKNSLNNILRNERYIGVYKYNEHINRILHEWAGGRPNPNYVRIEDAIPAIIDYGTWMEVQKRMDSRKKASGKAKREYLLSGLMECTNCGATYVGHCSTRKGREYKKYICGNKYRTKTCHAKNIDADFAEMFVIENLRDYLTNGDLDQYAMEVYHAVSTASVDLAAERREIAQIDKKIGNGMNALLNGFEFPELQEEISRLRSRKSELEKIISYNTSAAPVITLDDIRALFADAAQNLDKNPRAAIRLMVQKIYTYPDGGFDVSIGVHLPGSPGRV